ncbi:YhcH/YjgK/YiaL family protein [Cognataquiflexum rubidum]|uniref:YhcH/YjgK/YiaL family protein n=1 Tax=Cognataquiflexum rubidum TaxID=2922273 RepID=UPI001F131817|nr:YhcH/YjgK/YiaL family protein [Cognataquiflexum rubidum]MCH6233172.1 YhcH/YjgK/YiaL family protein [Cognataquiflexum rubidum]
MKTFYKYLSAFLLLALVNLSCSKPKDKDNMNMTEEEISDWYSQKKWLGQSQLDPHPSIEQEAFAKYYFSNQQLWDKAFDYLNHTDFDNLELGIHEIQGRELFVMVTAYDTKLPEEVFFENHKNYTDIQYVVTGREYIGLTDIESTKIRTPYEEERDITFYEVTGSINLSAHPGTFFIFFPHNVHCPALRIDQAEKVKKIVIKVKNK